MSETIKVPAEHARDFRFAVVAEVKSCAEWVASAADELSRHSIDRRWSGDAVIDIRGASEHLSDAERVLMQIVQAGRGPYELRARPATLAHMAETMVNKVIAPQIASATSESPLDGVRADALETLTRALGWASGEAARLHAIDGAERKAAKVKVAA